MKSTKKAPASKMMRGDGGKRAPARMGRPIPGAVKKDSGGKRKSTGKMGR